MATAAVAAHGRKTSRGEAPFNYVLLSDAKKAMDACNKRFEKLTVIAEKLQERGDVFELAYAEATQELAKYEQGLVAWQAPPENLMGLETYEERLLRFGQSQDERLNRIRETLRRRR